MFKKMVATIKARHQRNKFINRKLDNLTDDTLLQRSEEAHHVKA